MSKTTTQKQQKGFLVPVILVALVVAIAGIIFLSVNRAQQSDPTMTAAPPPAHPGQMLQRMPDKMANMQKLTQQEHDKFPNLMPVPSNMATPAAAPSQ